MNLKKLITMVISVMLLLVAASPIMAASNIVITGQGKGVSSQAPTTITSKLGTIQPNATTPPPSSAGVVYLGTYNADVTWATGPLYSDKWVNSSTTTIKIDAKFGQYATQQDAINRINPESVGIASVPVALIDSSGRTVGTINFAADNIWRTGTYTVSANVDHYVFLQFRGSGKFFSGPFQVYN